MDNMPIGVFDSGIGGLTVLEQLVKTFPHENFVYVADEGHCPYGIKTNAEIAERVQKITKFLIHHRAKAIVIACNTASVHIAEAKKLTSVPVISVIQPTALRAVELTKNKKVAVLATQSTITNGNYQRILHDNGVESVPLACTEFIEFLEHNELTDPKGKKIVTERLQSIKDEGFDVLIHGCTHFSLLEPYMKEVLPENVTYVACGQPTGDELLKILNERGSLTTRTNRGKVSIYTTGDKSVTERVMRWFKAPHGEIVHTDIE